MRVITRWRDIPDFETPEDERKFWSETSLDPRLMNSSILKTDNRESMTVTLRFDPRMLARIKPLAEPLLDHALVVQIPGAGDALDPREHSGVEA